MFLNAEPEGCRGQRGVTEVLGMLSVLDRGVRLEVRGLRGVGGKEYRDA